MGLRIRKSVKLAPGVRVNFGTKSGSVSVGGKGVYYRTNLYGGKKKKKSGSSTARPLARFIGQVLYWTLIGWWWWPMRWFCYDLPKFIIVKVKEAKKPEG